MDKVVLT